MSAPVSGARTGRNGSTRRQFLLGGAVAGVGAAVAVGADLALSRAEAEAPAAPAPLNGSLTVPFHGIHQAGIDTAAQAHGSFVALDLRPEVDRDGLRRPLRILPHDAARRNH